MKSLHLMCPDGGNECPATLLPAMKSIYTVWKYLIKFGDNDYIIATLRSIRNEMYKVQQTAKKQKLTVMGMWAK